MKCQKILLNIRTQPNAQLDDNDQMRMRRSMDLPPKTIPWQQAYSQCQGHYQSPGTLLLKSQFDRIHGDFASIIGREMDRKSPILVARQVSHGALFLEVINNEWLGVKEFINTGNRPGFLTTTPHTEKLDDQRRAMHAYLDRMGERDRLGEFAESGRTFFLKTDGDSERYLFTQWVERLGNFFQTQSESLQRTAKNLYQRKHLAEGWNGLRSSQARWDGLQMEWDIGVTPPSRERLEVFQAGNFTRTLLHHWHTSFGGRIHFNTPEVMPIQSQPGHLRELMIQLARLLLASQEMAKVKKTKDQGPINIKMYNSGSALHLEFSPLVAESFQRYFSLGLTFLGGWNFFQDLFPFSPAPSPIQIVRLINLLNHSEAVLEDAITIPTPDNPHSPMTIRLRRHIPND